MDWIKLDGGVRKVSVEVTSCHGIEFNFNFGATISFRKDSVTGYKLFSDSGVTKVVINNKEYFYIIHRIDIYLSGGQVISYASPIKSDIESIERQILGKDWYVVSAY